MIHQIRRQRVLYEEAAWAEAGVEVGIEGRAPGTSKKTLYQAGVLGTTELLGD